MGDDSLPDYSILYNDYPAFPEFPEFPDFPSLSASSSFSSSWDVIQSEYTEEDHHVVNNHLLRMQNSYQPSDCTDGTENVMDGSSDIWDDHDDFSSVFGTNNDGSADFQHQQQHIAPEQQEESTKDLQGEASNDVATVFLEWLKSNKESISPEDLRKVKLKRSTIESAIKRYGGGKVGMKKLLKLILEWIRSQHIQNQGKRAKKLKKPSSSHITTTNPDPSPNITDPKYANFTVNSPPDHSPCFSISNWNTPPQQPPPSAADSAAMEISPRFSSTIGGYTGETVINFDNPCPHTNDYRGATWSQSPVAAPSGASKEARQKRMARQKRVSPHHRHHQSDPGHHIQIDQHIQIESYRHPTAIGTSTANENYANSIATSSQDDPFNWVCWP